MDERDMRMLERLSRDPLAPLTALASDAGLTANAARARIARLKDSGVLMGVYAFPNPALFDRHTRIAIYAPPVRKLRIADTLDVDDVLSYSLNHDGQVAVTYYAEGRDDPPAAALDKLMGAPAPRAYLRESPPLRPPGAALSTDQWRIVEAMLDDGRLSARAIAERTGISERVVARARRKMIEGGHVTLVPGILSNLAAGIVLFHLFVAGPGTRDESAVLQAIGSAVVHERTRDPDGLYIFCGASSFGDALVAKERAAALAGVVHVELVLEKEAAVATSRMKRMCRERREGLTTPRA